ncbi:BNI1-related protein 1 [Monosporozyma unispora]|nr:hypothetical protein C6P44_002127 [Kazachstania unispora]
MNTKDDLDIPPRSTSQIVSLGLNLAGSGLQHKNNAMPKRHYSFKLKNKSDSNLVKRHNTVIPSSTVNESLYRELDLLSSSFDTFPDEIITNFLHQWERQLRHEINIEFFINSQSFIPLFITKCISHITTHLKWEFITLNCFQSIFKHLQLKNTIRQLFIADDTETQFPLIQWFMDIIQRKDDFESIKIKCESLKLLLTLLHFLSNHNITIANDLKCHEVVWNVIHTHLSSWLEQLSDVLTIASSPLSTHNNVNKIIHIGRINGSIPKFLLLSLKLINTLVESFTSITTKYIIVKELKLNHLHDMFFQLDCLSSLLTFDTTEIMEQITIYKDIEKTIILDKNKSMDDSFFSTLATYNKDLTLLIERTDKTPLEKSLNEIFHHLVTFMDNNSYSESINLFKSMDYLSNYFNHKYHPSHLTNNTTTTQNENFQDSMEKLMDNLQSDEISKRAMDQLRESKKKIKQLNEELSSLQNITHNPTDINATTEELKQANLLLDEKENDLETLSLQNRHLEEQLRKLNQQVERLNTHQRFIDELSPNKINVGKRAVSLFESLKSPPNQYGGNSGLLRKTSMKSSQRLSSLSSYLKKDEPIPSSHNPFLTSQSFNQASTTGTHSLSNPITSEIKTSISTPYKLNVDGHNNTNISDYKQRTKSTTNIDNSKQNLSVNVPLGTGIDNISYDRVFPGQNGMLPAPPPLPASLNILPKSSSSSSSIGIPTIFGNHILTSASSLLSTDSIVNEPVINNYSTTELETSNSTVIQSMSNTSQIHNTGFFTNPGGSESARYSYTNHSDTGLSSSILTEGVSLPDNIDPDGSILNKVDGSVNPHFGINNVSPNMNLSSFSVPNASDLPDNLSYIPSSQSTIIMNVGSGIPPPPPPPLPDNLSTLSLSRTQTNRSDTMNLEDLKTPVKNIPPPPPLPSSLTKMNSASSITSTIPPPPAPPPPPPLPPTMKKSDSKDTLTKNDFVETPTKIKPAPSVDLAKPTTLRLKQIHWDKIENVDGTVWDNFTDRSNAFKELQVDGVFSEIEDKFKIKENISLKKKINKDGDINGNGTSGPPTISFLSRDLQQQFGINLHMYSNLKVDEFVGKVLNCDNDIIKNVSVLEFFSKDELSHISPSLIRKYEPYVKDDKPTNLPQLERADEIFVKLCYHLREYWGPRSKSLLTLSTYEKDYYDLIYKLQKIDDAIQQLQACENFQNVLYIIIEIGNYMNTRSASGIKISSLNKLIFIKSSVDNNDSFLHFIERIIRNKYPDLMSFIQELENVENLGKITIDQLEIECQEFCQKINTMYYNVTKGRLSDPNNLDPMDKILSKIKYKTTRAKNKGDLLRDHLELTLLDMENLFKYYGEDYKDIEVRNKFFQQFIEFIQLFKRCNKENVEKEAIEKLYNERNKAQVIEENKGSETSTDENAFNNLLSKLREVEKPAAFGSSKKRNERRNKTKSIAPKTNSEEGEESINHDTEPALLQRAQTMLNNIQNI